MTNQDTKQPQQGGQNDKPGQQNQQPGQGGQQGDKAPAQKPGQQGPAAGSGSKTRPAELIHPLNFQERLASARCF